MPAGRVRCNAQFTAAEFADAARTGFAPRMRFDVRRRTPIYRSF